MKTVVFDPTILLREVEKCKKPQLDWALRHKVEAVANQLIQDPELVKEQELITFFSKAVSRLDDRELLEKIYKNKELVAILQPELGKLRTDKRLSTRARRKMAKMRLAEQLGAKADSAGAGTSGATIAKGVTGKSLGLIKPLREAGSWFKWAVSSFTFWVLRSQPVWLNSHPEAGAWAEKGAYITSEAMGFTGIMPEVELMEGRKGSFMVWCKPKSGGKLMEFGKMESRFEARKEYTQEEIRQFQKFVLFDYLIGNLDRHNWNWLVEVGDQQDHFLHIHAIDHDRAFPQKNPSPFSTGSHNQYRWGGLKIAKIPFTEETKDFIRTQFTDAEIDAWIQKMKEELPGLMTPAAQERCRERAAVIRRLAEGTLSPKQLSALWTTGSISTYLNS